VLLKCQSYSGDSFRQLEVDCSVSVSWGRSNPKAVRPQPELGSKGRYVRLLTGQMDWCTDLFSRTEVRPLNSADTFSSWDADQRLMFWGAACLIVSISVFEALCSCLHHPCWTEIMYQVDLQSVKADGFSLKIGSSRQRLTPTIQTRTHTANIPRNKIRPIRHSWPLDHVRVVAFAIADGQFATKYVERLYL
jgi:hypothetical protein